MNLNIIIIIINVVIAVVVEANEAQDQCRIIHQSDIEPSETMFLNQKCLLNCNVHGKIWPHHINEGGPCPLQQTTGVCLFYYYYLIIIIIIIFQQQLLILF